MDQFIELELESGGPYRFATNYSPAETGAETHADPDALREVFGREQAASGSSLYPPDRRLAAILPLGRFAAASTQSARSDLQMNASADAPFHGSSHRPLELL